MITEGVVLLRVQHLQQGGRGVAAEICADFVYFVQHEEGVDRAGLFHGLEDASGKSAYVSPAVTPNLGFVADTAQADADEFPPHGFGDRPAQAGLADAGSADKAEYRASQLTF